VIVLDLDRGVPVAVGNSVPFAWDGHDASLPEEGWDAALRAGVVTAAAGGMTAAACALSITVDPSVRGHGVSRTALRALRGAAAARGCVDLVGPLRPTGKCDHPHMPMASYVAWEDAPGRSHDPWLRVHRSIGATVAGICPRSMTIPGTLTEWEAWTGRRFDASGPHVVPHALVPVDIDVEAGTGRYVEPNVWVRHRLGAEDRAWVPHEREVSLPLG
jgi:GNAT superfamily N-acetyltransferase